jgi:serralysin
MKKPFLLAPVLAISLCTTAQIEKIQNRPAVLKDKLVMVNTPPAVLKNTVKLNAAYDFSKVKICIDQPPVANNNLPPRTAPANKAVPKINSDGSLSAVAVSRQPLVAALDKMWNPGDVIKVYLNSNNMSERTRFFVEKYAKEWERYANIKFEFVTSFNDAAVKVRFDKTNQSWSWVGRDVQFNPFRKYTMNFGWFNELTTESEYSRVVSHEFGHVLGFLHEHQSPASPLEWDKPKTYAYFAAEERGKWPADQVDVNVINKYSTSNTNFSQYDPYSIMHYIIPNDLLLSGKSTTDNYMISGTDAQYARIWYPFPVSGKNTTGSLRTGDDCDDVAFTVEYNAVAADQVEFILELGAVGNKKVTWWKQIGVPRTNNTETLLWVQNHSLIANENRTSVTVQIPVNEIDSNKPVSFWKGKLLSIHTQLGFKWNVLPAIKGGCRIRLVWNKDSCL